MRRVLVVDDSPVTRAVLSRGLVALGASVVTRASAAEAREIDPGDVDAVLCDVDLGDGWGPDACCALARAVPVAFLSGGADEATLARAAALGPLFDKAVDVERALRWAMDPAR
ncbi:MAG: response regulator [Polyangiaceae bacterium]|nr:response regulator [Polyangiaceae bacterium]